MPWRYGHTLNQALPVLAPVRAMRTASAGQESGASSISGGGHISPGANRRHRNHDRGDPPHGHALGDPLLDDNVAVGGRDWLEAPHYLKG